ncbi:MAG: DUF4238 domain-containing protein [Lachnospiraceae bacterium]|nr:DUF4238 domain-containing protein [Lachnospiraceae bacterium]
MNNEHIRQHYIPQFIIRNFCKTDGKVYYYDKKTEKIEQKYPKEIFVENNLYKYLNENKEDPNIIEKDLAEFENVAAKLIKSFKENYSVEVDYKKNELLKYFFFIMMFRSKFMTATYNKDIFNNNKNSNLTPGELDEFYKKNLGRLVKCRSLEEAVIDDKIDRQFIRYAIDILFGSTDKHLVLFESAGKIDFILGDVYPIGIAESINFFGALSLTCLIFPISYNRAIAIVDTYSDFHEKIKQFKVNNKNWYQEQKNLA